MRLVDRDVVEDRDGHGEAADAAEPGEDGLLQEGRELSQVVAVDGAGSGAGSDSRG